MWDKLKEQFHILKLEKKKLYLVTNSDKFMSKDEFLNAIASALQGGVDIVQFREKVIPDNVKVELGHKIRTLCDEYGATFIVNDRADIALTVEADGVHLGHDDLSIADAKEILGENSIIGKSCSTTDDVIIAVNEGADYITFGPIYTDSKKKKDSIDLNSIKWVQENIDIPIFYIGEINSHNINKLIQVGIDRVALTEAVMYAKIPEESARNILSYLP